MIEIRKINNPHFKCQDIEYKNKDNSLYMTYGGNGDLYWHITGKHSKIEFPYVYYDFVITKEDYDLYEKFRDLYNKIFFYKSKITNFELENRCWRNIADYKKVIEEEKRLFFFERSKLVFDDKIIWYSEDCIKDEGWDNEFPPSWVIIKPIVDGMLLQFKVKVKKEESLKDFIPDVTIRFCNDGCRYRPFNGPFMELYNEMMEYDDNYHQMHIEEFMYLTKGK